MNVELTPGQKALIQHAIDSGRIKREEDAIAEALALWEHRERRRLEIDALVSDAKEQFGA
jgi:Arc/MetJ-type ribon-helix-helix transcriptional regulator